VPVQRLTEEQMQKMDDGRSELYFRKGELLTKQGMLMTHVFYLRTGFAKMFLENSGEKITLGIARPGTFIGIQSLYGEPVFPFSAEAMTDVDVCLKDIDVFRELVMENAGFAQGVIEILNTDLIQSYNRMFSLTTKQIDGRFSELLLFLANVFYQSNPFDLTISRREIAELISTTPESVSRLISKFRAEKIISGSGHTIELVNLEALEAMCHCKLLDTSKI
jgi:CRP/FNR family transcriptional regulator